MRDIDILAIGEPMVEFNQARFEAVRRALSQGPLRERASPAERRSGAHCSAGDAAGRMPA